MCLCVQVVLDCGVFVQATEEDVAATVKELAAKRGFPETHPDGKPWKARDVSWLVCRFYFVILR